MSKATTEEASAEPRSPYACTNCQADPARWYTDPARCNPWKCLQCSTWNDIPPGLLEAAKAEHRGFSGDRLADAGGIFK